MSGPKLGPAADALRKGLLVTRSQITTGLQRRRDAVVSGARRRREAFVANPFVSALNANLQHMVSQDNLDNMKDRYNEMYHWLAGTEVTEIQEKARFLESKMNRSRKDVRESREALDGVVERLRDITNQLEHTGRGDVKHLHLRQLEYETIQEELKLSKQVQKSEFQERETFTMLMNANREAHETERNYNSRIKMISLIGAILGPVVGYLFSARLNQQRFSRMEKIIDGKLQLLSFSTLNAIREIHGLDPEVVSEPERRGLLSRLWGLYGIIEGLLLNTYSLARQGAGGFLEAIREAAASEETVDDTSASSTVASAATSPITSSVPTMDSYTQTPVTPPAPIIVEVPAKVNYSELPEFQALVRSLQRIEKQQGVLKELLQTEQVAVSVSTSDEEIIALLQSDQQTVRQLLSDIQGALEGSKADIAGHIASLASTVESLSLKLTNASELYVGGLEHSKIVNDMAVGLVEVREQLDRVESCLADGLTGQAEALAGAGDAVVAGLDGIREEVAEGKEKSEGRDGELLTRLEELLAGVTASLEQLKDPSAADRLLERLEGAVTGVREVREAVEGLRSEGAGILEGLGRLEELTEGGLDRQNDGLGRLAESVAEMRETQGQHFTSLGESVTLLKKGQQALVERPDVVVVQQIPVEVPMKHTIQEVSPVVPSEQAEVVPSELAEVVPSEQAEVVPSDQAEVVPSDQAEVVPSELAEVVPLEEAEVVPSELAEVVHSELAEVVPSELAEVVSSELAEVVPSEQAEVVPSEQAEVVHSEQAEVVPTERAEVVPSEKAEVLPSEEIPTSVENSEIVTTEPSVPEVPNVMEGSMEDSLVPEVTTSLDEDPAFIPEAPETANSSEDCGTQTEVSPLALESNEEPGMSTQPTEDSSVDILTPDANQDNLVTGESPVAIGSHQFHDVDGYEGSSTRYFYASFVVVYTAVLVYFTGGTF